MSPRDEQQADREAALDQRDDREDPYAPCLREARRHRSNRRRDRRPEARHHPSGALKPELALPVTARSNEPATHLPAAQSPVATRGGRPSREASIPPLLDWCFPVRYSQLLPYFFCHPLFRRMDASSYLAPILRSRGYSTWPPYPGGSSPRMRSYPTSLRTSRPPAISSVLPPSANRGTTNRSTGSFSWEAAGSLSTFSNSRF